MAIRSVAVPLLGGGAVMLGFAALSLLRNKHGHALKQEAEPRTLREAGLPEPHEPEPNERPSSAADETGPLSERSPDLLELDLDLEFENGRSLAPDAALEDALAPEDLGAHFLARATDALSPFGGTFEPFEFDRLSIESAPLSEATIRAASGRDALDPAADDVAESERRPTALRVGARS